MKKMASAYTSMTEALEFSLILLRDECDPQQHTDCIVTLLKIFRNVSKNPTEAKYREIKTTNKAFAEKVWQFSAAQQLMIATGWSEVEDQVILLDDQQVTIALQTLEQISSQLNIQGTSTLPGNSNRTEKDNLLDENRRKQIEQMRKEKEERKRIAEQIKSDRRETKTRPTKDSVARPRQFGANINRFEDIGVDLNKGGG